MSGGGRIGIVITTHDRVDDARVSQELIRNVWGLPEQPLIVHAYNGDEDAYREPYLEDELVRIENTGHFRGAGELIDAGCAALAALGGIRHAVVLSADTWLLDGGFVSAIVAEMEDEDHRLAAAPWGYVDNRNPFTVGLSTDFFVVDLPWALRWGALPIDYGGFEQLYGAMMLYSGGGRISLEKLLMTRMQEATLRETKGDATLLTDTLERIRPIAEREPIHPVKVGDPIKRREEWLDIGLIASHDSKRKREVLRDAGVPREAGPAIAALIGDDPPGPGADG